MLSTTEGLCRVSELTLGVEPFGNWACKINRGSSMELHNLVLIELNCFLKVMRGAAIAREMRLRMVSWNQKGCSGG